MQPLYPTPRAARFGRFRRNMAQRVFGSLCGKSRRIIWISSFSRNTPAHHHPCSVRIQLVVVVDVGVYHKLWFGGQEGGLCGTGGGRDGCWSVVSSPLSVVSGDEGEMELFGGNGRR
jgi:hypothetical protein